MKATEKFAQIAMQPRFAGWPRVGEYRLGAKIPFFGQVLEYQLLTGNGIEDYYSILRHFGWAEVFGVTREENVITLVQWKPGVNKASWELAPGGIGKISEDAKLSEVRQKTQQAFLVETGYGEGNWSYLGSLMVESGKYRGAGPEGHGLPAHLFLATDLVKIADARKPNPNEIIEVLEVPLDELREVLESGLFEEISAVSCAYMALLKLEKLVWKI